MHFISVFIPQCPDPLATSTLENPASRSKDVTYSTIPFPLMFSLFVETHRRLDLLAALKGPSHATGFWRGFGPTLSIARDCGDERAETKIKYNTSAEIVEAKAKRVGTFAIAIC